MFQTAILFLIFNRPETTKKVFAVIQQIKPSQLFIAADGPRVGVQSDADLCFETRRLVLNSIDWDCKVTTLFREENLGCGRAVSDALIWFFDQVPEGIILEDDTLPETSFFSFCSEMLERYRQDDRIWSISGFNFGYNQHDNTVILSKYMNMWGWATWRRSAIQVDYTLQRLKNQKSKQFYISILLLNKIWEFNYAWIKYWVNICNSLISGQIDTWDYQWIIRQLELKKNTIYPPLNLVQNIGFSFNATHTNNENHPLAKINSHPLPISSLKVSFKINKRFEEEQIKKLWGGVNKMNFSLSKYVLFKARQLKYFLTYKEFFQ